jgi:hypothetical protein
MIKDLIGDGLAVADKVDQFVETGQERQATLTERHKTDMQSDNWLSKSIRPLSVLILLLVVSTIAILSSFGYKTDPILYGEISAVFMTALGFYFNSKKAERVMQKKAEMASKNAKANIQLETLKTKHELKQERKELRHERRLERRRERKQDKED